MRRFLLAVVMMAIPATANAQALTARDIIHLTRAGLSEEVLLALIEVHRPVFPVDPDTLTALLDAGVHKSVIVAMVKSGRETPAPEPVPDPDPPAAPAPPPHVVVVERERAPVREIVVPVAVPVYVPVHVHPRREFDRGFDRDFDRDHRVRRTEPVYWGFGGRLRPDAWQPDERRNRK